MCQYANSGQEGRHPYGVSDDIGVLINIKKGWLVVAAPASLLLLLKADIGTNVIQKPYYVWIGNSKTKIGGYFPTYYLNWNNKN